MIALAAAAHPDDIEFMMAGTLLRLKDAGCRIHLWNLANGCCGSNTLSREEAAAARWAEAQASAKLAGGSKQHIVVVKTSADSGADGRTVALGVFGQHRKGTNGVNTDVDVLVIEEINERVDSADIANFAKHVRR